MKRLTIIFILAVFLVSVTGLNQLLKLPLMLEHFAEHKNVNKDISFLDFLQMHYIGYDYNDNDQERDRQLPFKSFADCPSPDIQFFSAHPEIVLQQAISDHNRELVIKNRVDFQSSYFSSIWQPPRSC